jgi:AcrR family transcriptional regulator
MRRRLKPDARRLEIIQAAEKLLKRHGNAVRVEDVVAEARAAKGTFYTYFATWDDLLEEIRKRKLADIESAVAPIIALGLQGDWHKVLPSLAAIAIDFIVASGGLHEALFHSSFTRNRPLPDYERPPALFSAVLSAGMAAGAYAKLDPEPTGALVWAIIHETGDAIVAGADRKPAIAALEEALHRLVFASPSQHQGRSS